MARLGVCIGKEEGKGDLTKTVISERGIGIFLQFQRTHLGCCFVRTNFRVSLYQTEIKMFLYLYSYLS